MSAHFYSPRPGRVRPGLKGTDQRTLGFSDQTQEEPGTHLVAARLRAGSREVGFVELAV